MREVDSRQLAAAVDALPILQDDVGRFLDENPLEPRPGSMAETESAYALGHFKPVDVYSQAGMLIRVAADHLMALYRTVQEPAQSIAPFTSARSLLEASAIASWLIEPGIEPRERVARGFSFRYEGLEQQVKAARAGKWPAQDLRRAEERIDIAEKDAVEGYGFPRLRNSKGKRNAIGQAFPAVTEIIKHALNDEAMYRTLSAMAHGHSWAVLKLSYYQDPALATAPDSPTVRVSKTLYSEHVVGLCWWCSRWFTRPIWLMSHLFGLDIPRFEAILEKAADTIGGPPKERYWRPR